MDLRLRLNLLMAVIFGVTLAVGVIYLFVNVRQSVADELRASGDLAEILLRGLVEQGPDAVTPAALDSLVTDVQRDPVIRHLRFAVQPASRAAPRVNNPPTRGERAPAWFAALAHPGPATLERRVATASGDILVVADPADEIAEAWREARATLLVLGGGFFAVGLAVFIFLGRALEPLVQLSRALHEVEQGDFAARLPRIGLADVDRLSDRFNDMAAALARSRADNVALARRSLAIQEEERRHLAHELHDELGQSITAIKALAVSIGERVQSIAPPLAERATTIVNVSSDIYARVRRMMAQLHPVVLDELGLSAALESMIDDWNAHHDDCFCVGSIARAVPALTPAARVGLYRVAQEALTNIARHARASRARVELAVVAADDGAESLQLAVSDDGAGFDPRQPRTGLGLRGMQERAAALGGTFTLDSAPGRGTRLRVCVPLPAQAAESA